ncbi:MAG: transketolase family protein [Candidatus Pacebacteria bacterium]|nr:transketolase family protein [Candidatus Paceibacterota bacterium]
MLNTNAQLHSNLFDADALLAPTRDGFGKGVVEAGQKDERVVVLCADLAESTRAEWFQKEFPKRYVEIGVAEQNLAAVASGFANYGKIPFITSYAAFNPGRNNEQIRTTASLANLPVKVCGMHAGVSVGPDGATHQALEDIGLMRMQPNMVVIVPMDAEEARKATYAAAFNGKPTYLRFGREKSPVLTTAATPFEIGKGYTLWESESPHVAIIGCGTLLFEALKAARALEAQGVRTTVINMHTVKPLDTDLLYRTASAVHGIVTVEEHQAAGGLGSAVAEFLAEHRPVPMEMVAVRDRFGQSGTTVELYREYGLDQQAIEAAVLRVAKR